MALVFMAAHCSGCAHGVCVHLMGEMQSTKSEYGTPVLVLAQNFHFDTSLLFTHVHVVPNSYAVIVSMELYTLFHTVLNSKKERKTKTPLEHI